jgi:hypothetical protein
MQDLNLGLLLGIKGTEVGEKIRELEILIDQR